MTRGVSAANVANKWLDVIRDGGASFTVVADTFVKLHTGDPGAAGTANAAVGDATRKAVAQAAPSGGSMAITGTPPEWTNGGTSETITDITVWDTLTAGNFLYSGQLTTPQAWVSGNTFKLNTLTVAITPIAA